MLDDVAPPYPVEVEPDAKPPMPDAMRPLAEDAIGRAQRRPAPPAAISKPVLNEKTVGLECPYAEADEKLWWALLLECFGTRVYAVGAAFLEQLAGLCPDVFYEGEPHRRADEERLQLALAIVYALKPRDEAQAALAAQSVAVHFAAMKVGALLGSSSYVDPRSAASLAALVKAYGGSLETMRKVQGKGGGARRQSIKVEKHVHYHDERHVHVPGGGGGNAGSRADGRSESRARATPSLPSPNEGRDALQIAPSEGPEAVPVPWRGQGERRAEG